METTTLHPITSNIYNVKKEKKFGSKKMKDESSIGVVYLEKVMSGFSKNVCIVWSYSIIIILNKPYFYKVL